MFNEGVIYSRPSFLAPGSFRLKACVLQHEELCFWSVFGHCSASALSGAPGHWMLNFAGATLWVPGSSFPHSSAVWSLFRTWKLFLNLCCQLCLLSESSPVDSVSCVCTAVTYPILSVESVGFCAVCRLQRMRVLLLPFQSACCFPPAGGLRGWDCNPVPWARHGDGRPPPLVPELRGKAFRASQRCGWW